MNERRSTLSVIVISFNEEDRIDACLSSVAPVADEIIVVDSGSDDRTVEIARRYTDKVYVTDWPGYGPQKQRALDYATGDWVLSIDCDEALDAKMQASIRKLLTNDAEEVAYRLPWGVTIYGKRLDYGRSARAPLRLFRRAAGRFSPDQVHEKLIVAPGKLGTLGGRLLHYTHRDFGHALDKAAKYAWLGAQKKHAAGKRGGGLFLASLRAAWVFVHIYVFRGGFLDGRVGYLMAVIYSQVEFNKYAGLWAIRRMERLERASSRRRGA
ncbi:glycosyltransferase family 2 protein [Ectothiorhodospiraceae bacterium 2226]|nr:glycosyltransferase family 2 protein [Ectothiorhodospiraceae bacterium 2226]